MGTEIERKFLVVGDAWRKGAVAKQIRQGYLAADAARGIAVRVRVHGERATLNIKATRGDDLTQRDEYEYAIPLADATAMLDTLCGTTIDKTRHEVLFGPMLWEIDEFEGANAGLIVAEIELDYPDEPFEHPQWLGEEVSDDPRYLNQSLAERPYREWGEEEDRTDRMG